MLPCHDLTFLPSNNTHSHYAYLVALYQIVRRPCLVLRTSTPDTFSAPHSPHRTIIFLRGFIHQDKVEEETTVGALELLGLDEEFVLEGGAAEVEGDGDAEEGDDDGHHENNDGDAEVGWDK